MADIELSAAVTVNERTTPLLSGAVTVTGVRLLLSALGPSEMFWRQLKFAEFDVSEMSLSDFMMAVARGSREWLALPVYTLRRFYHTQILIHRDAGIARPQDLRGKRIGVPEYQLTSIVWARGVVEDDFGVKAAEMDWFSERRQEMSHGDATAFEPPSEVRLSYIRPDQNLGEMLMRRELDALFHYIPSPNLLDRSKLDLRGRREVTTLYPDAAAEGRRYFAATGIFPVNHCVVIRRALIERHPWVGLNLYDAFVAAKAYADAQGVAMLQPFLAAGLVEGSVTSLLENDPWAYGMRNSRKAVETIERFLFTQGLVGRRLTVDELFVPSSLTT